MEIEIITTKKKLTKSIVNQMPVAKVTGMEFCLSHGYRLYSNYVLGIVVDCRKGYREAVLIKGVRDYEIIEVAPWEKSFNGDELWYKQGKGNARKKFKTQELRDNWFDLYTECVKIGRERHIYI